MPSSLFGSSGYDLQTFSVNGQQMKFECGDWKLSTENGIINVGNTYSRESVIPLASLGHHYPLGQLVVKWERSDGTQGELFPNGERVEVTEGMKFTVRRQQD